jgi:hypothetical protein
MAYLPVRPENTSGPAFYKGIRMQGALIIEKKSAFF